MDDSEKKKGGVTVITCHCGNVFLVENRRFFDPNQVIRCPVCQSIIKRETEKDEEDEEP